MHSEQLVMSYPHNLYLHLLLTLGVFGTACMLLFLVGGVWRVSRGVKTGRFETQYERGFVLLGVLVLGGFLIDQIKIEFLRQATIDYVHFVFALFGLFLGLADAARVRASQAAWVESGAPNLGPDEPLPSMYSRARAGNRAVASSGLAGP